MICFFFIEFIGLTLINKFYRIQKHDSITHHLHTVLCVHCPQSSLCPSPFIPPLPSSTTSQPSSPSNHCCLCPWVFLFCFPFLLNPSTPVLPARNPTSYQPALYKSVSILLVSSFCSSDFTYEWNHIVLVFLWLAYFI